MQTRMGLGLGLGMTRGGGGGTPTTLVVALGNSLTQGSIETIPWPNMLDSMLDDTFDVINEGYSGQTTQQLLTRVGEASFIAYGSLPYTRRIAVVWECRNDMVVNGITPEQAVDNLEALCNGLPAGFTDVWVCTTTADGSGNANFTPADQVAVNSEMAARYTDFADGLIDLGADARLSDTLDTTYFKADQIHFNNPANEVVATLVKAALASTSVAAGLEFSTADATAAGISLFGENRNATKTSTAWSTVRGNVSKTTGKWYFEVHCGYSDTSNNYMVGLATAAALVSGNFLGGTASGVGFQGGGSRFANGFSTTGSTHAAFNYVGGGGAPRRGMVLMVAVDFDAGKIWTGYNAIYFGDPVSSTGPAATFTPGLVLFPGFTFQNPDNGGWTLQTSAGKLSYDPPAGFAAWGGGTAAPSEVRWNETEATAEGFTLSNSDKRVSKTGATWQTVRATLPKLTGKHVFEVKCAVAGSVTFHVIGLCNYGFSGTLLGDAAMSLGMTTGVKSTGFTGTVTNHTEVPALGLSIMVAVDFDNGKIWEARNGVWRNSGDPAAGTGNEWGFTPGTALFPAISLYQPESGTWDLITKASDFTYSLPAGFTAWGA